MRQNKGKRGGRPGLIGWSAAALLGLGLTLAGCAHRNVETVGSFPAARQRSDYASARALLAPDPRIWYEEKSGAGAPWNSEGGRWKAWDEHFRGVATPGKWHVADGGLVVWSVFTEINDYYRLTDRGPQKVRLTYFFDVEGRITGYMVQGDPAFTGADPALIEAGREHVRQFEEWAARTHPQEWAYLRPGGEIDPTDDRAARTRALLDAWRRATDQPRID